MIKKNLVKVIALIIQIVFFFKFKFDRKKLELYDIYINVIMPLISIILFFVYSCCINKDAGGNVNNGNRTVLYENGVNDINEADNNGAAVDDEVDNEINNRHINNGNEIIVANQNNGQPNEQQHLNDAQEQERGELYNDYTGNI